MTVIAETPSCLVQALLTMLPRLEAEESQLAATRAAVGAWTAGDKAAEIQRGWIAQAAATSERPAVMPRVDVLKAHGFKVRRVPKVRP
jgi:hypothetical protein